MTREDVKKLFPDATDEQVTAFLNKHNSEIAGERAKTNSERQRANHCVLRRDILDGQRRQLFRRTSENSVGHAVFQT